MPTGGVLPPGADAVVMVEYTQQVMAGTIEVVRPVAPGEGVVRADEDAAPGAELVPAGRPLRAQDLAMLAAAGVTTVAVHARPRVTVFSTGDEVVPPEAATLRPGQVRDASAVALAAMVAEAGGEPVPGGIVPDDAAALEAALRAALPASDLIVISAGSSVGSRDETAGAVRRLGPPGIWCHGIAIRPGKPTLLAECDGVPVIGLPGNPRSALVVFRLLGDPAGAPGRRLHDAAAQSRPCAPGSRATCRRRPGASTSSRSRSPTAWPRPCSGCPRCCPCSPPPTGMSSFPRRPPGSTRVPKSRSPSTAEPSTAEEAMTDSPFIRDVPASRAHQAWRDAREAAGCPARIPATRVPVAHAAGLVTAGPVWAVRSSPPFDAAGMDGIAVCAADTLGASETTPVYLPAGAYDVVDTGDPMPGGRDAVVMREHVHYQGDTAAVRCAEIRSAVPPYQHVRSIGEDVSAGELLLPEGHRLRAADLAAAAAAGATQLLVRRRPVVTILPTGDEVRPIGERTGAGEITDTNSLMLATQAREAGCEAHCLPIEPDDPERIAAAVKAAVTGCDLLIIVAGSSAGRDDYTARVVAEHGTLAVHGVAVRPGHPVVLGVVGGTPVLGAPGYPVSAALTFDIFAEPLLAELMGAPPRRRPRATARLARKLASPLGLDDWVRVRLGVVGGIMVASPLPRGAGVLTSLVRADGLLVVPAGLEGHHAGAEVGIELLRGIDEIAGTIVAIGSHDLVLDLAASALRAEDPMVTLASSNVGSLGGLVALRDGLCHLAGSHLLDPATGEYTLPYLDRVLPGADVCVVRLVHRDQGLMVAPGNPAGPGGDRRPDPGRRPLRQPAARRGHPRPARLRAGAARRQPGRHRRLRPGGAYPPGGGRGRGGRPRRRGPGHHGGRPLVRPRFRAGHPGAL